MFVKKCLNLPEVTKSYKRSIHQLLIVITYPYLLVQSIFLSPEILNTLNCVSTSFKSTFWKSGFTNALSQFAFFTQHSAFTKEQSLLWQWDNFRNVSSIDLFLHQTKYGIVCMSHRDPLLSWENQEHKITVKSVTMMKKQ